RVHIAQRPRHGTDPLPLHDALPISHPPAPGSLGRQRQQPLRPGRGRAGAALEHPPLRRHPVRRRSGWRQPGRVRRRQPGWQPPHDPTMVQPAPALLTMNHPDRPREDTTRRPPRTAWIAALALAIGLALPAADTPAQERGALPEQGRVVSGKSELRRKERSLTVTQRTQRAILEWRSFDIS